MVNYNEYVFENSLCLSTSAPRDLSISLADSMYRTSDFFHLSIFLVSNCVYVTKFEVDIRYNFCGYSFLELRHSSTVINGDVSLAKFDPDGYLC